GWSWAGRWSRLVGERVVRRMICLRGARDRRREKESRSRQSAQTQEQPLQASHGQALLERCVRHSTTSATDDRLGEGTLVGKGVWGAVCCSSADRYRHSQ